VFYSVAKVKLSQVEAESTRGILSLSRHLPHVSLIHTWEIRDILRAQFVFAPRSPLQRFEYNVSLSLIFVSSFSSLSKDFISILVTYTFAKLDQKFIRATLAFFVSTVSIVEIS
jgi:hypothetical protein